MSKKIKEDDYQYITIGIPKKGFLKELHETALQAMAIKALLEKLKELRG